MPKDYKKTLSLSPEGNQKIDIIYKLKIVQR